jgi:hypothetical protein
VQAGGVTKCKRRQQWESEHDTGDHPGQPTDLTRARATGAGDEHHHRSEHAGHSSPADGSEDEK